MKHIYIPLILLIIIAAGCAGQGGNAPQLPAPQKAQTYAQPTIRPFGSQAQLPQAQQPQTAATNPLIQEKPGVVGVLPTSTPGAAKQPQTLIEQVEYAQEQALLAQGFLDDCFTMATREAAHEWEADCTPLRNNLTEANRRLSAALEAAK